MQKKFDQNKGKSIDQPKKNAYNSLYPQKIHKKARELYEQGYSMWKIGHLPDLPSYQTIKRWAEEERWDEEIQEAIERGREKRIEALSDRLAEIDLSQLRQLTRIRDEIGRKLDEGEEISPRDLKSLMDSLDKAIKNERLIHGEATERSEMDLSWKEIIYGTKDIDNKQLTRGE